MTSPGPNFLKLAISVIVPLLAGAIGSLFTSPAIPDWYATLVKPELNPPSWVFGPVWTTLFILMGIGAFLVWKKGIADTRVRIALILFIIQLITNVLWSAVFFGMQSPGGALAVIVALWILIAGTIVAFAKVSKTAAWLLVPYIAWVSFAAYLNYSIWSLN